MKDPLVGTTVGDYRILAPLGEGGMGIVYAAVNPRIEKKVAIKVLKLEGAEQDRLIAEAVAVNAVGHRNVVTIFASGTLPDGRRYLVMEYLDGQPLDAYLADKGTLPPLEVCELLQEVCAPLHAAHQRGVVHRDLKPQNIFLVKQADGVPFVKVLDFGLARLRTATKTWDESQTRDLVLEGTPEYMAPEQCTVQPVGAWTDLYALGTIAYELLSGAPPFRDPSAAAIEVMTRKVRRPAPKLDVPGVPPQLVTLVAQLLETDPLKRPSSADAVRNQLRRIARMIREGTSDVRMTGPQAEPIAPKPKPAAPPTDKVPPLRASKAPLVAGGVVLAVLLAAGGAAMLLRKAPAPEPVPKPAPAPVPEVVERKLPPEEQDGELSDLPPAVDGGAAAVSEAPRPRRPVVPTIDELQKKLASMESRHKAMKEPDPEARVALNSFRVRITVVSSPADRMELMRDFVAWEKKYSR